MFVTVFCFLVVALIFLFFGKGFIIVFYDKEKNNYGIFDTFFIGLCLVGTLLNAISLFVPVNIYPALFLLIGSGFIAYWKRNYFKAYFKTLFSKIKSEKVFSLLTLIAIIIVLLYALIYPRSYDSYLYHINAIQWNEMFGTVPGLANLHDRFGLNSSIFVLSACFSFTGIYNQYIFTINSLCFLVLFIWLLKQIYFNKGAVGLFSLLFLYFFTEQYGINDISSPGTDLLPNILIGYLLLSLLFDSELLKKRSLVYIILPLFCLTLKLSAFPIVILSFVTVYMKYAKPIKASLQFALFGLLMVLPWMVKNVILTGYLIYPIEQLDLFDFDWEVSKQSIIIMKNGIGSYAKLPGQDFLLVSKMPFTQWFPMWWKAALVKNQCFYILAAVVPFIFILYSFFTKKVKTITFLVISVAYFNFLFWFFTAPDVRFSFASVLFLALLPLFLFKEQIDKVPKVINPLLIIGFICSFYSIGQNGYKLFCEDYDSIKNVSEYSYLPVDMTWVKDKMNKEFKTFTLKSKQGKEIILFEPIPAFTQCYDKFPCSWSIDSSMKLRGEDLKDGFRVK